MGGPAPPVAATRVALRQTLAGVRGPVLVACSGGPDSMALASATAFVAPRLGLTAGLVTVDHGLQSGSASRAARVAEWGTSIGLSPSEVSTVDTVGRPGGPEAAAREARYEALVCFARKHDAVVLLGHTRDDQAETVLLALARGAGPRGLAGMPERRTLDGVTFLRPFLSLSRKETVDACAVLGLSTWDDPHNADPAYTRSRLRAALPLLAEILGPDVVPNLARTARLVAEDLAALDALAATIEVSETLDVSRVAGLPAALRTRVLRAFALRLGTPAGALSSRHIDALDRLVTGWRGQGPVALPGGIEVTRSQGTLSAQRGSAPRRPGPGTSTGTHAESPPPAG